MSANDVFARGRGAIITGGASGIGLATARRLLGFGMRVVIADADEAALDVAAKELAGIASEADVLAVKTDVSSVAEIDRLAEAAFARFEDVAFLMNNAAAFQGGDVFADLDQWRRLLEVNVVGVLNGTNRIGRRMVERKRPGAIVNTGSKQGITQPPGNTAYNVSKAAVKSITEGLAHTLRNTPGCQITAHLLIPGFTFTGRMQRQGAQKPPAAWTPEQVADRLIEGITHAEFYILCQDNETTREQDERRILWAAGDIVENRSALSRWDPKYKSAFDGFMAKGK